MVTLDTNVRTLSFGFWKDAAAAPSTEGGGASTKPLSPQSMALMASPRRGTTPGTRCPLIGDWGIAFEGLPLDVKLYPGKISLLWIHDDLARGSNSKMADHAH